jgi:uncharacterized protein with von Willebrand factor type A (vWA) domain
MLPHVDAFLPAHNIDSLIALGRALSAGRVESGAQAARRAA